MDSLTIYIGKALIAPHAGFRYSGNCAGKVYSLVDSSLIETVFVFGPAHHAYINGISLTRFNHYDTPLGNIEVDAGVINSLSETGSFGFMDEQVDVEEHSLELHLPFIYKIMNGKEFKLVPLLVGHINQKSEEEYAVILKSYFESAKSLFVFSSDFCHW